MSENRPNFLAAYKGRIIGFLGGVAAGEALNISLGVSNIWPRITVDLSYGAVGTGIGATFEEETHSDVSANKQISEPTTPSHIE